MNSASASSASISSHKRGSDAREFARGKALTSAAAGGGEDHRVRRGPSRGSNPNFNNVIRQRKRQQLGSIKWQPSASTRTRSASSRPKATSTKRSASSSPKKSSVAVRGANGKIKPSASAREEFMKQRGYPKRRKGYAVDHIVPLECGGADEPSNMKNSLRTVPLPKLVVQWLHLVGSSCFWFGLKYGISPYSARNCSVIVQSHSAGAAWLHDRSRPAYCKSDG